MLEGQLRALEKEAAEAEALQTDGVITVECDLAKFASVRAAVAEVPGQAPKRCSFSLLVAGT